MTFKIPIIDDILKGIPDNARLRSQVSELISQVEILTKENEKLKVKLDEQKTKTGLKPDTPKALVEFFKRSTDLSEKDLSGIIGFEKGTAGYHISILHEAKLIRQSRASIRGAEYKISSEARKFVVNHGLV